ncbi:MAG: arsenate reductase [Gammaproteobacteria bacterium]|nr:MAG: arsenate reductase [Gammaproteobacteria bacterium]
MLRLYGIKNCDSVKKAVKQLNEQQTPYEFVDLKQVTLDTALLKDWLSQQPKQLVNKRSTTYRSVKADWLAAEERNDRDAHIVILQNNPTLIKRPVIQKDDGTIIVGFDAETYQQL